MAGFYPSNEVLLLGSESELPQGWETGVQDILHLGGRLFQQFVVDQYCKIEEHRRLNYLRLNQENLRSDLYNGSADAMARDGTRSWASNHG